jgi:hypothetical protein
MNTQSLEASWEGEFRILKVKFDLALLERMIMKRTYKITMRGLAIDMISVGSQCHRSIKNLSC